MGRKITITATSGIAATEVTEEDATEFAEVYETLERLPSGNQANVDFDTKAEANAYVRVGKAWAEREELVFARKGPVKANPTRVSFRIYAPGTGRGRKPGKK
jgi:hypothetical protein